MILALSVWMWEHLKEVITNVPAEKRKVLRKKHRRVKKIKGEK